MQKAALPTALKSWGLPPAPSKRTQIHASKSHQSSKHPYAKTSQSTSYLTSSNKADNLTHISENKLVPSQEKTSSVVYFKKHPTSSSALPSTTTAPSADQPTHSDRILHSSAVYIGPPKRKVGRPGGDGTGKNKSKKSSATSSGTSLANPSSRESEALHGSLQQDPLLPHSNPEGSSANEISLISVLAALSSSSQNAALLSALSAIDSSSPSSDTPNPALVDALKQLLSVACPPNNPTASSSLPLRPLNCGTEKSASDDDIVILNKENVDPGAFRRKVDKDDTSLQAADAARPRRVENKENSSPSTATSAIATRKRRLSDFMDELDREQASRSKARSRGDSLGRRHVRSDSATATSLHQPSSNPYHRDAVARTLTSPPRGARPDLNSAKVSNVPVPASSPVRRLKPYVVPAWARTTTATQPRFSKEMEEHWEAVAAENKRKKSAKKGKRTSCNENDRVLEATRKASRGRSPLAASNARGQGQIANQPPLRKLPEPIIASSSLPVFASDLSLPPSSPPPPTSPLPRNSTLEILQTPMGQNRPRSCQDVSSSLFTPTPRNSVAKALFHDESPLFSPEVGAAFRTGKLVQVQPAEKKPMDNDTADDGEDTEVGLSAESDDILDEFDFPPSSLPIASSDGDSHLSEEAELGTPNPGPGFDQDCEMQHWPGLPPSSPPPPTSPALTPQDLCTDGSERDDPTSMPDLAMSFSNSSPSEQDSLDSLSFPGNLGVPLGFDDFNNLFSDFGDDYTQFGNSIFSDKHLQDEGGIGLQDYGSMDFANPGDRVVTENGFVDFDLSEFWQSVKPLMGQQVGGHSETGLQSSDFDGERLGEMGEIDHTMLAAEVQALFSGCVM